MKGTTFKRILNKTGKNGHEKVFQVKLLLATKCTRNGLKLKKLKKSGTWVGIIIK
jgi:hypothetical protein